MTTGGVSNPSTRNPHSSLVEGFTGPRTRSRSRARANSFTVSSSARATSTSSTHSRNPKNPTGSPWNSSWRRLRMAATRPTGSSLRMAR